MGGAVSVDEGVHVVVVGGGFGGIAAGNQLKSYKIPFTLIDMKDAFHHNPGALRASVESGFAKKTFISFKETFAENFVQGYVINIDLEKQVVVLESGQVVHFSHLILGTGSSGPFPGKFSEPVTMENAIQMYEDLVVKVRAAPRIVVVGGGSAGVEMAAELKTDYPDKEVTLIHSKIPLADDQLLPSVRQGLKEILLRKGVQLELGQKVTNLHELVLNEMQPDMKILTDKGLEITADMVICCTGIKINSSAYSKAFNDQLAENGALHVNQHLQVSGMENVYAIGDCADIKEPKMAYHAGLHAAVAVDNIVRSLTKKPLKIYKPGALTMLLSMGRNDGIGQIFGFHVGKFVVVQAKSKDLLVWKSWREMGQTAPP
ncbi:ferroptosis suppressor protein 1-like [Pristis pectinata]|uniref:ferroptosis suppressor protein 1-like n=1 Tax=Pristis pectinata TaxID=685728 RepID=UPI00223CA83C|nr:ferroptosis suppressor protein 1-like [Pristis pectinata]XP_051897497.1 ferroptosis suppressor protein 1-like [Pristis pectinata]